MNLETDAISCSGTANLAKDKIKLEILPKIEKSLDRQEKISIIFLTSPTKFLPTGYDVITNLLEKDEENMIFRWLTEFNIENWEEKLLESLLLIQNFQIIRELGFTESEEELFRKQFQIDQREVSPNLNRVLKTLYTLCEELGNEETKQLVSQFEGIDIQREELELYLLYWIKTKRISVSESSGNLKALANNLKKIQFDIDSETYLSLENWNERERNEISKIPRNMQDARQSLDNSLPIGENFTETRIDRNVGIKDPIYEFNRGLCLIINEEHFDSRRDKRKGSQYDVRKLRETFENFGYEIKVKENLTAMEIREQLKIIGNYTKKDYDCVILCILSHGEKRTVLTKDGKSLFLEEIKDMICTPQLKNVVKIILVQACQGEYLGHDTTDGPSSNEILSFDGPVERIQRSEKLRDNIQFADLVMFVATIPFFKSIRNTEQGSWFIQTICKVLESEDRISWKKLALRVKNQVSNERGIVGEGGLLYTNIVQIPEIIDDRLIKDFIFEKKKKN